MKSSPTSNQKNKKKVYFKTFGCQMNEADSERMSALLEADNYIQTGDEKQADLVIVNTCSVRDKAYHKAISAIGKHNKSGDSVQIGVTGCVASQEGKAIAERFENVDFVLGTDHIGKINEAIQYHRSEAEPFVAADFHEVDAYQFPKTAISSHQRMVSAFVTIMKGCDNTCAFCIVPSTRGPEISRSAEDIIGEIQSLEAHGVREITLLGQNVNSYGKHLVPKVNFADLLQMIEMRTHIDRLRFTSPHPKDLSPALIEEYQRSRILCRHMHLPAQSGSSRILKRMRRAHTRKTYLKRVEALRKLCPEVAISTDLIVGFPSETEEEFQETLSLMREVQYDASYSFAYSERPGTEAAGFEDDVDPETKSRRLQELQALQNEISYTKNQEYLGQKVPILVEGASKTGDGQMMGRSSTNRVVNFEGNSADIGAIVSIKVERATAYALYGKKDLNG